MPAYLSISDDLLAKIDQDLAQVSILHRQPALKAGLRAAGKIVEKRYRELIPKPGYPGDKPDKKPLRDTVATEIKEYSSGVLVGIVGAKYPAGAHAHLLEEGHRIVVGGKIDRGGSPKREVIAPEAVLRAMRATGLVSGAGRVVGFVPGRHYLQAAVDGTKHLHDSAVLDGILKAIAKTLDNADTTQT